MIISHVKTVFSWVKAMVELTIKADNWLREHKWFHRSHRGELLLLDTVSCQQFSHTRRSGLAADWCFCLPRRSPCKWDGPIWVQDRDSAASMRGCAFTVGVRAISLLGTCWKIRLISNGKLTGEPYHYGLLTSKIFKPSTAFHLPSELSWTIWPNRLRSRWKFYGL